MQHTLNEPRLSRLPCGFAIDGALIDATEVDSHIVYESSHREPPTRLAQLDLQLTTHFARRATDVGDPTAQVSRERKS